MEGGHESVEGGGPQLGWDRESEHMVKLLRKVVPSE